MSRTACIALFCMLVAGVFAPVSQLNAQELLVGISENEPFVFIDESSGRVRGFSIDLWDMVADKLGVKYHFIRSKNLAGELDDVIMDRVDVALGGIAVNEERERLVDFTYPYYRTGLGILVRTDRSFSLGRFLASCCSVSKLQVAGFLFAVILLAGHLIWLAERKADSGKRSFNRKYVPGVLEGMYWTVVTASTVGYGDRAPATWPGRILAICLIVTTLPLFAFFIAELSSNITLYELRTNITGPRDLIDRRVGVMEGSTSLEYVSKINAVSMAFDTRDAAYDWLLAG